MGKILNSIFGPKEYDVIYVPNKVEKKPEEKLEETIKSINSKNKPEDAMKQVEPTIEVKEEIKAENKEEKKEEKEEKKSYFFKPTEKKTLSIFLIEDSKKMYEYNKEIVEISKRAIGDNLAMIIHYGSEIENPGMYFSGQVDEKDIICVNADGQKVSFYDAILELESIVNYSRYHSVEGNLKNYEIENIEIIGFSTGEDNSSIAKIEDANKAFKNICESSKVSNKCFCILEDNFIKLASIGFHSIGRIRAEL